MAQPVHTFSITAPGFAGLNTQDAPVDLDAKFALIADNCVIDKYGRVGSRKGWTPAHETNTDLGSGNIECIGEYCSAAGERTILAAGNGHLFKITAGTPPALDNLVTLTYGGGGTAPTITENNWQMVTQNGAAIFFQLGYDPLIYEPALSTTEFRRLSEHPSYSGTVPLANCAVSAYGRVWCASTTSDKQTVSWSDTLTHHKWTGGSSGSLNLLGVWPQGGDEIVALAAHNNRLFIFGTKQTLIYSGANTPSTMTLEDAIANTGCIGRDTVQNTESDIIFLSDTGVRSVKRTIQENSAPTGDISRNVQNDVQAYINNEGSGSNIKSGYSPIDSIYLLTFVNSNATYCFDTRGALQDGSLRATTWTGINPKAYSYSKDRVLYMGQEGAIGKYDTYYDNGASYRMLYYTSWVDFGDPIRASILKKIVMTLFGTIEQNIVYKWGFDYIAATGSHVTLIGDTAAPAEYNIAEYSIDEYSGNLVVKSLSVQAGGAGKVIQVGFEAELVGYPVSIQRVDIYTKDGRY